MSSEQSSLMQPQHRSSLGSAGHSAPSSRPIVVLHSRHDESWSRHISMSKSTVLAVTAPNKSVEPTRAGVFGLFIKVFGCCES
jgi:hypothetical protein